MLLPPPIDMSIRGFQVSPHFPPKILMLMSICSLLQDAFVEQADSAFAHFPKIIILMIFVDVLQHVFLYSLFGTFLKISARYLTVLVVGHMLLGGR